MKAIIFDMDGVLVDTMPSHYNAMKAALKDFTNIDLDKTTFYLLEGMPIIEMTFKIFDLKGFSNNTKKERLDEIAEKISSKKKEIFMQMNLVPESFRGARELILDNLRDCLKAVVTGSSEQEVQTVIDKNFGKDKFDVIINGDDFEGKGKPDPSSYLAAIRKLGIVPSNALIVENAPLGVQAANNAGVQCIVVLNSSPLSLDDFKGRISQDRVFKDIMSATKFLRNWCFH
jgi:HAD superfamily hydrolase (TIGR01509 family)